MIVLTNGSFFFNRKYSEGRKDHWFVSDSNGLSYASKFFLVAFYQGCMSEHLASYL